MPEIRSCPSCGSVVPDNAPSGICPACLMGAGMVAAAAPNSANASPFAATTPQAGAFVPLRPEELAAHFPHLEIQQLLGHGGMGAVYKARQTKLDRLVALKLMRPESADDPMFTTRFNREAKTLARLNHPNIVSIYDFGEFEYVTTEGDRAVLYYFLMEYVDGVNLRQLIQSGNTEPAQALAIVQQMCEALQFAHNEGVIHRDIKPENMLLDKAGRLKVADFGLAKLGHEAEDLQLTGTRQVLGTVQYMAPEQMTQSKTVDHRADIYSMGVVFYELLTGEIPMGAFEPPSRRAAVDSRLDDVVMKTLATDPDQRYQHASDVGGSISSISGDGNSATAPQQQEHWRGPSTIMEDGVAALAAGVQRMFVPGDADAVDDLGTTDVTLQIEQVRNDQLPDLCIVCGTPSQRRISREFEHLSEAGGWLVFVLIVVFFPVGILAAILLTKKVRGTLPVCATHVGHWSRLAWFASLGWLFIPLGVLTAFWLVDFDLSNGREVALFVGTILCGVAAYVVPLIYLGTTRVSVQSITQTTMTLKRASVKFAREIARNNSASAR